MSDYTSNCQIVDLGYSDFEDMQKKAAVFNQLDPNKWEERMRVIPTVCLIRSYLRDMYESDYAFVYDFTDDDISFFYRRLGYKLIVCGDVFVHHEGSTVVGTNVVSYANDLEKGREVFRHKHYGIDAWDDVNNYEVAMCECVFRNYLIPKQIDVLGIDVRCGTPLLTLKNLLRRKGERNVMLNAYTTDPKYWLDLKSICTGVVAGGNMDGFAVELPDNAYSLILLGEYLDTYQGWEHLLQMIAIKLRDRGRLVFKCHNFALGNNLCNALNILRYDDIKSQSNITHIQEMFENTGYDMQIIAFAAKEWVDAGKELQKRMKSPAFRTEYKIDENSYTQEKYNYIIQEYIVVLEKQGR